MSRIIETLLNRVEKQDQYSIRAARALLDQARNNTRELHHCLSRLTPLLHSSDLDLRAVTAGILGYISTEEAIDFLLEEIEVTSWKELSAAVEQSEGLSDEPLYVCYTSALAESLGGEPTIYGMRLLEYLVCDGFTRPEIRAQAMTTMYYAISSMDDYRIKSSTADVVLQLSESNNDILANASLQLLGEINENLEHLDDNAENLLHAAEISDLTDDAREQVPAVTSEEVLRDVKAHIPNQFQALSGREFERFMKVVFERMGYQATMTPASNDFGADLVLKRGNENIAVQLKRYGAKQKVGNAGVSAIVGAMAHYRCNKTMVVTTARFTRQAVKLADSNNVELWDWDKVHKVLKRTFEL